MKDQLRKIGSNPLVRNFASVGFIQGLSLLLPLLTIPYLLTTLGAEGFALVNIALAVVTYFVVFTDYGFNLMGTRLVALHKADKDKLNNIFSNMLYAQLLLVVIAVALFSAIVFAYPAYRQNSQFFFATFGVAIGSTLLPTWFFQGFQKFNHMHFILLGYRAIYTVGIFVLIHSSDDLILVPILNSATSILGGLVGLIWVMTRYGLRFTGWSNRSVFGFLKEGWNLFTSALAVTSIQQLPIIILSFFVNTTLVGYYAFAEKILLLFRVMVQLISTLIYPRVIAASQVSLAEVKKLISKVNRFGIPLLGLVAILLLVLPTAFQHFLPAYYNPSMDYILRIWSLLPLALFLKITSQQILLAYDYTKTFARYMILGAVLNLLLLLLLTPWLQYSGAALAVLLTEVFLIFAFRVKNRSLSQNTAS